MSLEAFFQMIESLAVVVALIFALLQVKQYRRRQVRESAMELLSRYRLCRVDGPAGPRNTQLTR